MDIVATLTCAIKRFVVAVAMSARFARLSGMTRRRVAFAF
jgi:hypothetical protein